MGRTLTAIAGLVSCVVLSGCSSDSVAESPDPTPTPSTTAMSTPTSPTMSSTPPEPPPPQPPRMPALAREKSPAGAKAFVRYYIEAVNYAWLTHSTELLKRLSTDRCMPCSDIAKGIDDIRRRNGETQGALWRPQALVLIPFQSKEAPIINVAIATSRGRWKPSAADGWTKISPAITRWDMHLSRDGQHWVVGSAEVQ